MTRGARPPARALPARVARLHAGRALVALAILALLSCWGTGRSRVLPTRCAPFRRERSLAIADACSPASRPTCASAAAVSACRRRREPSGWRHRRRRKADRAFPAPARNSRSNRQRRAAPRLRLRRARSSWVMAVPRLAPGPARRPCPRRGHPPLSHRVSLASGAWRERWPSAGEAPSPARFASNSLSDVETVDPGGPAMTPRAACAAASWRQRSRRSGSWRCCSPPSPRRSPPRFLPSSSAGPPPVLQRPTVPRRRW